VFGDTIDGGTAITVGGYALVDRPEIGNSVDIDISKEKFMEMEVVDMSNFEILSLMIGILSIIVKLLLEIIKGNKK